MEGTNVYYYCVSCGKPLYEAPRKVMGLCEVCFFLAVKDDDRYKKGKK